MQFEDVGGITVFTYFDDLKPTACQVSQDEGIITLCSNIENFQVAGYVYSFFSVILLGLILSSIMNLLMLITTSANFFAKFRIPHFINAGFYVLTCVSYLLLSNIDSIEPETKHKIKVQAEHGIAFLFLTALIAIITLGHYLYLRRFKNLGYLHNLTNSLVPKQADFERQTESTTNKLRTTSLTIKGQNNVNIPDIEEVIISPVASKNKAESGFPDENQFEQEIKQLKIENAKLMKDLDVLRRSLEETRIDDKSENVAALQGQLDAKDEELQRIRNLLEALRRQILQKDMRVEELEGASLVNQQTIEALKENKEELNKFLMDREKRIDELRRERDEIRRELNTKTEEFDAIVSEYNSVRKELVVMRESKVSESFTEFRALDNSTLDLDGLKEKITQLNLALERQKLQTNDLTIRNQSLEMAKDELDIRYKQLSEAFDEARKQVGELQIKNNQFENLEKERIELIERVAELNSTIDKSKLHIKELNVKIEEIEPVMEKYENLKISFNKVKADLSDSYRDGEDLRQENVRLGYEIDEKNRVQVELEKISKLSDVYLNQLQDLRDKYSDDKTDWEAERSDLGYSINQLKREVEQLQKRLKSQEIN